MIWTIDRIEDGVACIETTAGIIKIDKKHLPEGVVEGNKLILEIDEKEEMNAKERIKVKMDRLFTD